MKNLLITGLASMCIATFSVPLRAADEDIILTATMLGEHEVPPINSLATGRFRAAIHPDGSINFTLTWANLSTTPLVSHIHFGQFNVSGGVMIFLCGGGGQPPCPTTTSATITGTITSANVVAIANQGINAGDLASALRIVVRQGEGYANLHSMRFPGGEIRGQVIVRERED
jgi:CHRD domain